MDAFDLYAKRVVRMRIKVSLICTSIYTPEICGIILSRTANTIRQTYIVNFLKMQEYLNNQGNLPYRMRQNFITTRYLNILQLYKQYMIYC